MAKKKKKSLQDLRLMFYQDNPYILDIEEGLWTDLSILYKKNQNRELYIKGLIRDLMTEGKFQVQNTEVNKQFQEIMSNAVYQNTVSPNDVNRDVIVFKNGVYSETGFTKLPRNKIPFSPFQIPRDYVEDVKKGTMAQKFIAAFSDNDKEKVLFNIQVAGATLMARPFSMMPIYVSKHSTSGKGTFMDLLTSLIGYGNRTQVKQNKFLGSENGQFALATMKNRLLVVLDELPQSLASTATENLKEYVDSKKFVEIEKKGIDGEAVLNTPLLAATTNKDISIHNVDDAIKKRLVFYIVNMNKGEETKFSQKDIDKILEDEDGIDWLTNMACKAIFKVVKDDTKKVRNEKFSIPKESLAYWDRIDDNNIALEILETGLQEWDAMLRDKTDMFINNVALKLAFETWKLENKSEKITVKGFKHELENLFSAKRWGDIQPHKKGGVRGLAIKWYRGKNVK